MPHRATETNYIPLTCLSSRVKGTLLLLARARMTLVVPVDLPCEYHYSLLTYSQCHCPGLASHYPLAPGRSHSLCSCTPPVLLVITLTGAPHVF